MFVLENVKEVSIENLHAEVARYKATGYRFVTATSVEDTENDDGGFWVYYHFDKDLNKEHFKVHIKKDQELESISSIFWAAFVVENEIQELHGIKILNKAIDFAGRLMLAEDAPQCHLLKKSQDFQIKSN